MPGGPFAHVCLLVRDLDQAIADWTAILEVLDPEQLAEPTVVDHWEAGEDVMSSATFVSRSGCEIQLLCPLNDGPLGRRLEKRGEGVHHICFTAADLPGAVREADLRGADAGPGPRLAGVDVHRARVEPRTARRARLPLRGGRRPLAARRGLVG